VKTRKRHHSETVDARSTHRGECPVRPFCCGVAATDQSDSFIIWVRAARVVKAGIEVMGVMEVKEVPAALGAHLDHHHRGTAVVVAKDGWTWVP
jgi:hypothetical protein